MVTSQLTKPFDRIELFLLLPIATLALQFNGRQRRRKPFAVYLPILFPCVANLMVTIAI